MPKARRAVATTLMILAVAAIVVGCALTSPPNYNKGATGAWWKAHHEAIYRLMIQADAVANPQADVPGYAGKCQALGATVAEIRALPKLPSPKLEFALNRALTLFEKSVSDCAASFNEGVSLNSVDQATTSRLSAMNNAAFGQVRLRTILSAFGKPVNGLPSLDSNPAGTSTPGGSDSSPGTSVAPASP